MSDYKLTVIVPAFNNERTIACALKSVFAQDVFEFCQLLVFDERVAGNLQYLVAVLPEDCRDFIQESLMAKGIFARKYFSPGVHQFDCYPDSKQRLPQTEDIGAGIAKLYRGVSLIDFKASIRQFYLRT